MTFPGISCCQWTISAWHQTDDPITAVKGRQTSRLLKYRRIRFLMLLLRTDIWLIIIHCIYTYITYICYAYYIYLYGNFVSLISWVSLLVLSWMVSFQKEILTSWKGLASETDPMKLTQCGRPTPHTLSGRSHYWRAYCMCSKPNARCCCSSLEVTCLLWEAKESVI